jgi:hypothetical protein
MSYFYPSLALEPTLRPLCLSEADIKKANGSVVKNVDGTISVYMPTGPVILTKTCCEFLNSSYTFDLDDQKCRWAEKKDFCELNNTFKIGLNPKGNDGNIFAVGENESCNLNITFDYVFKIKCDALSDTINGVTTPSKDTEAINTITSQIITTTSQITQLNNTITATQIAIAETPYSINCTRTITFTPLPVSTKSLAPFTKTGFGTPNVPKTTISGGFLPFAFPKYPPNSSSSNYCLSESGLAQWAIILGVDRYDRFLAGDATSYTCDDVDAIVAANNVILTNNLTNPKSPQPVLITSCDVAFGTKTNLISDLNRLNTELSQLITLLTDLNTQLDALNQANLNEVSACKTVIDVFESLDVSLLIETIETGTTETILELPLLTSIGTGGLYNYLSTNENSGFYVCGDPSTVQTDLSGCTPLTIESYLNGTTTVDNAFSCENIVGDLLDGLFKESGLSNSVADKTIFNNSLKNDAFSSQWLTYNNTITDPDVLSQIKNKKIKISFKINNSCSNFCILLDDIELNKVCSLVKQNNIFVSQSPGFEMERIRDNKKSWVSNTTLVNRDFSISNLSGTSIIRTTDYDVNDERLVINTKEIDLDISLASAIETNVWCFINDNLGLLTGVTNCDPCLTGCCGDNLIDFDELLTQPLSAVTTEEDFQYFLTSELIDVKSRQTLSGYPTLRALYDRYLNSLGYCGVNSLAFDYLKMEEFSKLVGTYWVDLVEQVVPATTIWGSVKVYSNTIFDQQKFKYRSYSSLFCENPFDGETVPNQINGTSGLSQSVNVITTSINNNDLGKAKTSTCNTISIAQMNQGSEFIGKITIIRGKRTNDTFYQKS